MTGDPIGEFEEASEERFLSTAIFGDLFPAISPRDDGAGGDFMARENVRALNLDKIAFRMRDRDFFSAVIKLLHDRHLYHNTLYSYAIFHADTPTARQFLTTGCSSSTTGS